MQMLIIFRLILMYLRKKTAIASQHMHVLPYGHNQGLGGW
jgi:hypothetical protein